MTIDTYIYFIIIITINYHNQSAVVIVIIIIKIIWIIINIIIKSSSSSSSSSSSTTTTKIITIIIVYYLQFEVICAGVVSIPGNAVASLRNNALILNPAFALLSINIQPSLLLRSSPSSTDTCLFSDKSVLLPTNIIITSLPLSLRTSSIHFDVFRNEARSIMI